MVRRWLSLMAVLLPLCATWALTNPMFASPDEPAHMARAQGFSRFDFTPPYETDGLPMNAPECYRFIANVTADCADLAWGVDGTEVETKTRDYPPLFHAVAAVPVLFVSGLDGAYAMRLWMAFVCCALLAWAGALLIRPGRGPWPVVGFTVALTPMSMFVSSTVNPSGITLSLSLLVAAGAVARWMYGDGARNAVVAMAAGAPSLLLVRRDSALWVLVLAVSLMPLALSGSRIRARLRALDPRSWSVRGRVIGLGVAVAVVASAVKWIGPIVHRLVTTGEVAGNGSRWQGLGSMRVYLDHMIGTFGWIDTFIGRTAFSVAAAVCVVVIGLGFASVNRRLVMAEGVSLVALFATPVVFGMFIYPYFQGRYMLPIWVIVAVMASLGIASAPSARLGRPALAAVLLVVWGGVHVWSLLQNLRRYAVGYRGTWWFTSNAPWAPPTMSNRVAVLMIVVASAMSAIALAYVVTQTSSASRRSSRRKIHQPIESPPTA
ncbi:MAG: DUF2142 domain-containing protein [Actinomycetota bacterium]